jgi:hypothetical protein
MSAIPAPRTSTWREAAALILVSFGGVLLTFVGWVAGVVLLWLSPRWSIRDKVLGTLVLPGGLALGVYVVSGFSTFFAFDSSTSSSACPPAHTRYCSTVTLQGSVSGDPVWGVLHVLALIVLFGAPLATAAYLARRLGNRPV